MLIGRNITGMVGVMSGIPSVQIQFLKSFTALVQYNERNVCRPSEEILYVHSPFSDHAAARNWFVEQFMGTTAEWLFQVDCDQTYPSNTLDRLLRTMNEGDLDVVVGVYHMKREPYPPVLYTWSEDPEGFRIIGSYDPTQVFSIDSAGGGCLLVRKRVFERIEAELGEQPFTHQDGRSEDHSFFYRLRLLDPPIQPWCDARVRCGHLRTGDIGWSEHERAIEDHELEWAKRPVLQEVV